MKYRKCLGTINNPELIVLSARILICMMITRCKVYITMTKVCYKDYYHYHFLKADVAFSLHTLIGASYRPKFSVSEILNG